jgi:thiopeptide-type bacteriocin biosynthesis protein
VIFAEIAHLPDSHLGNVLRRPAFRPHEIVFLSAPGVDAENQIHLNDLLVSVDRSEIILRDQKRNVRVIPRLGSAFNYTMDTLPVFEFLCSLQNDGYTTGLGFSWGALTGFFDFLPRVIVRNVVISPAQWNWNEKILKEATTVEKLKKLLAEHKLPERFLLSVGDQELLAEKNNDWLLEVLLDELKGKTHAVFKEYLHTEENPVKDKNRKELAHQFVATLLRKEAVFKGIEPENLHENVRRTFSPGSAWMYFKIYGGYRSLDQVLIMLSHIFQDCLANGQILKWFFIRYEDTDPHLLSYMGGILDTLQTEMKVSGWSLHPYERELERYGFESIDATESFFCVDSRLVCEILSQTASENERWLSGLSAINFYLDAMGLGLENKKEFMEYMRDRFMEEFRGSTGLKPQIDKLYRDLRPNVFEYLTQDVKNVFPEEMKKLAKELLTEISEKTASLPHWHRIMGSLLHMHVNRLMSADQRKQELVMYDFLVKFYTTQQAVRKK